MAEHETTETIAYETAEPRGSAAQTVADARALHRLATADPERDGLLTGPAHEKLYGLERADDSDAAWRVSGVHPTENRVLVGDEDGAENVRGITPADLETARAATAPEQAVAPAAAPATPAG